MEITKRQLPHSCDCMVRACGSLEIVLSVGFSRRIMAKCVVCAVFRVDLQKQSAKPEAERADGSQYRDFTLYSGHPDRNVSGYVLRRGNSRSSSAAGYAASCLDDPTHSNLLPGEDPSNSRRSRSHDLELVRRHVQGREGSEQHVSSLRYGS